MKKISKISVVLLTITLLISSFAIFASAETANAEDDYKAVLEYYEAGYFLNATFDDVTNFERQSAFDSEAFADSTEAFKASGKVAYINNTDGTATMRSLSPVYFDVTVAAPISLGVNTKIKFEEANASSFSISIHSNEKSSISNESVKLFEITPDAVNVYQGTESGKDIYAPIDGLVPGTSAFDIEFFYNINVNAVSITLNITPEASDTVSVTISDPSISCMIFELGFQNITMDYCEIYTGSFVRNLNGNEAEIVAMLNDLIALYNNATDKDDAFKYLEVAAKVIVNYGFSYESFNDNAAIVIDTVAPVYAAEYVNIADSISSENSYYDALSLVESSVLYKEFLDALAAMSYEAELGKSDEEISTATDAIAAEFARLEKAKADTLIAYDVVHTIPSIYVADYATLREAALILMEYTICETYFDDNHSQEEIALAVKSANAIITEYSNKDTAAKNFVENVPIMCDVTKTFADRYAAYVIAKDNLFKDSTYDDYADGISIESLYLSYEDAEQVLKVSASYAEEFLWKMNEASLTQSYSVRIIALDAAAPYVDSVERGYPGVKEALDKYYALRYDVDKKFEIARNYINAVLAINNAETMEEKVRAIEVAKAYAALGADVSLDIKDMDITVIEANIILSNEESAISLVQAHVSSYISVVNSIASKATLAEKRTAINRALELGVGVDTTADGVSAATNALNDAIVAYNNEVKAANAVASECNNFALETLSRTIPTERVAQVVAIVKKFFD